MEPATTRLCISSSRTGTAPIPATPGATLCTTLYLAFELGQRQWKLNFTTGLGQSPRMRTMAARDLAALSDELARAKQRFGLSATAPVRSCYEAGRDGFWLHRALAPLGVENVVVDSASIEVNRRQRRAKSDRLDGRALGTMLMRYHLGEQRVWRVVHVPTPEQEDRRQLHRELARTTRDRTRVVNRIKGLLATQGAVVATWADWPDALAGLTGGDGTPLDAGLRTRLAREWAKIEVLEAQRHALQAERRRLLTTGPTEPAVGQVRQLLALRAIGIETAWCYVMEFFSWRAFHNGGEVGALAGLTPTPYQSSDGLHHEQGISKAGNRHIRALAIESAWAWLRWQPQSELAQWYQQRFGQGSSRLRRIGIVALARKLLIALWRYLETGVVPAGAIVRA